MIPQEFVAKKRDGRALSDDEISEFVHGLTKGAIADSQAAAFAMAVFFRGLDATECCALTRAMAHSGDVLDWRNADLSGPVVDKHSTGGVGDLVSLVLAPIVAACGGFVPMIAGRGLGHTGGTIDKLEAIPGYCVQPDLERFKKVVREVGCAIIGQTRALAPADRRLYAIRDITGTVESIPLIVASILSKKLAAGLQALVMDVKVGSGAFMRSRTDARDLAATLATIADNAGLPTICLLTDMDQPLASVAGNALETRRAIDLLRGSPQDGALRDVTIALASEMLVLGGLHDNHAAARTQAERALQSGAAAERFARMVHALGGPASLLDRPEAHLATAPATCEVFAPNGGCISSVDARALGMAVVALGGGRTRSDDTIDQAVGLDRIARVGDLVDAQRPLARVHARSQSDAQAVAAKVRSAFHLSDRTPAPAPLILERISGK